MIQYELDYLGRIKFLHVEMPYWLPRADFPLGPDLVQIFFCVDCSYLVLIILTFPVAPKPYSAINSYFWFLEKSYCGVQTFR